jgi:signal-transduction protein with cAMP-binding, CBS, and nucleotidyltransferase domain
MDAYPPLVRRSPVRAARICRPGSAARAQPTFDSPAVDVMTDLTQTAAVVVEPHATMELAHSYMMRRGVRMLLALDKDDNLTGIVTANDILGERPVSLVRDQRIRYSDILVSDVMTSADRLEAFEMRHVMAAKVGHIVTSLQQSRRHHALVVQHGEDGQPEIRGIFSLSQIARQLGVPLQLPEAAGSFAEIEAALAG